MERKPRADDAPLQVAAGGTGVEQIDVPRLEVDVVAHVEADERHGNARAEDDVGRLRVVEDVELRMRRDVARHLDRAAHDHDVFDPACHSRLLVDGSGDVRQRAQRDYRQLAAKGGRQADQIVGGSDAHDAGVGSRKTHRKPTPAMVVGRVLECSLERAACTAGHRHVPSAKVVQQSQRITGSVRQRRIAPDRRQAEDVESRRGERHHQRQGIVGAGVGIDDGLDGIHQQMSPP